MLALGATVVCSMAQCAVRPPEDVLRPGELVSVFMIVIVGKGDGSAVG